MIDPSLSSDKVQDLKRLGREQKRDTERDEWALTLRTQGRPFAAIAHILGFSDAHEANAAFNRALRARPKVDQDQLRGREVARLEALALRVRGRDDLSVEEVVRRLRGLRRQRKVLFQG